MKYLIILLLFSQTLFGQDYLIIQKIETIYVYDPIVKRSCKLVEGFDKQLVNAEYIDKNIKLYFKNNNLLFDTIIRVDTLNIIKNERIEIASSYEKIEGYSRTNKIYQFGNRKLEVSWGVALFDKKGDKEWERLAKISYLGTIPWSYDGYQNPVFSNDGNHILFTHYKKRHHISVEELDVLTTKLTLIKEGVHMPQYSLTNKFILLEEPGDKYYKPNWYIYDRNTHILWQPMKNAKYTAMWLGVR